MQTLRNPSPPSLNAPSVEDVHRYFQDSWSRYEWLFSGLVDGDGVLETQPHPFRNTLGFYYGHTAAFYVQKLLLAGLISEPVDPEMDRALERGVSPNRANEIEKGQDWPQAMELRTYRRRVRDTVLATFDRADFGRVVTEADPLWALFMGIEHERIHFQTTIPLIRRIPVQSVHRPDGWNYGPATADKLSTDWVHFAGGLSRFGVDSSDNAHFAWDNEYGSVVQLLEPFSMRNYPVTNREMLDFVEDGGYSEQRLWLTTGARDWFDELHPTHPAAWVCEDGGYQYRATFDEMEMPWDWPVLVNRHEAAAFARWAGFRLPTEPEFRFVLEQGRVGEIEALNPDDHNVAMRWGSPVPVGLLRSALTPSGVELLGNVAFWAADNFGALSQDGFNPHPLYGEFSEPWFRADHGILLGAGFAATGHLQQVTRMRDFMQNHMDQIAGICLVS
ncbi:MAG: SUMF1/EgtB/PvdO family nonheme iron enzyme [Planctomycetales bacterium]|nr:SUMF1/EgtB/PvdO family nonheme iron enzyme [Planctomycetales bacterium]MCB1029523.1 SUMF1/EgtB/PvdO family nonheme iron enzyme [Microthrixaceae bacterium]MCB1222138.1 SUMF1/EgtB/PvdO family nonheme iron enzyme [bacterium]